MNFNDVTLDITAGLPQQLIKDGTAQIALSGRSNVGKSSFINRLVGRKNLARVSGAPGKTITVNYYSVGKSVYLVDLPGYGYAKRPKEDIQKWSALTDGYFRDNGALRAVAQLVDLKVGATSDDLMMLDWLNSTGTPYFVIATKYDKLGTNAAKASLDALQTHPYIAHNTPIFPFSALSGFGLDDIRAYIEKLVSER